MAMYVEPENGIDYYGYNYFFGKVDNWKKNCLGTLGGTGSSQLKKIKEIVEKGPKGAVYQIKVAWQQGSAHAFNAYNDNGVAKLVYPQDYKTDASYYFNSGNIKPSKTCLVRVDNLDINENVKDVVYGWRSI